MPKAQKKTQKQAEIVSARTSGKSKSAFRSVLEAGGVKELLNVEMLSFLIGLALLVVSLFLLLAIISNVFTGKLDQAGVESHTLSHPVANYAGVLGAYSAHFLMNNLFGLCSIFIPLFFMLLSMKLMRAYKVRLWKWFINFSVIMVWGSVALSFAEEHAIPQSWLNSTISFYLGGGHGNGIRDYLETNVGALITLVILAALAICYLIYISSEIVNVVRKMLRPQDHFPSRKKKSSGEGGSDESDAEDIEPISGDSAPDKDGDAENDVPDEIPSTEQEFDVNPSSDSEPGHNDILFTEEDCAASDEESASDSDTEADKDEEEGNSGGQPQGNVGQPNFGVVQTEAPQEAQGSVLAEDIKKLEPYDPRKDLEHYHFPSLSLLDKHQSSMPSIDMAEQIANKDRITTVLHNFGVEISSIKATVGPTVTLYEITPAVGVRIAKIRSLEDDIALSLSALGIRIIAPIPGKGTIGIEVPNKNPQIVSMESILNSRAFQETTDELPIALGKTISNEVFIEDLAKLPHLLVAGATGQGKSVGLNAIITSLLYKKHPAELKLVMVDPKRVEFSMYKPLINHFLAQMEGGTDAVITDTQKVVQTLKSLCKEMDNRYELLPKAKCKNIKEYNAKFKSRLLNPEHGHRYLPYIVVIIDEYGDLIMTAGKEIETPIARLAQLARAIGIHLIIATQSPRATIITGKIKANFPARMAFRVAQGIESQTILDRRGANQLIGRGDMLVRDEKGLCRVQCAYVDTPEVERITEFISHQQGYLEPYMLPEVSADDGEGGASANNEDISNLDRMFREVAFYVVNGQQGSTSSIQRHFSIGYNRAGRLMDQLEKVGIVGPAQGSKPREVYIQDETSLEQILSGLNV